jgi:hypothetical protein
VVDHRFGVGDRLAALGRAFQDDADPFAGVLGALARVRRVAVAPEGDEAVFLSGAVPT